MFLIPLAQTKKWVNLMSQEISLVTRELTPFRKVSSFNAFLSPPLLPSHVNYALSSTALQINKILGTLIWDNNQVTVIGYSAFSIALSRNRTLKNMPLPMVDFSASLKSTSTFLSFPSSPFLAFDS
jgi:hypothetical protein